MFSLLHFISNGERRREALPFLINITRPFLKKLDIMFYHQFKISDIRVIFVPKRHIKNRIMRRISSKEFRNNQALYFDQADNGEEILVQRGKTKSYRIVPIIEIDTIIEKEFILEPDNDLERAISFDRFLTGAKNHIHELYSRKK